MSATKNQIIEEQEAQLPETGLSLQLSGLMTSNKASRTAIAQQVVQEIAEGQRDATQTLIYVKKAAEFFTLLDKNIKPFVAGTQIQKGGLTLYDATIISKSDPAKWDFTVCDDKIWNSLTAQIADLSEKLKTRETFLKTMTEDIANMDGEVIHPPSKTTGAENISITLK